MDEDILTSALVEALREQHWDVDDEPFREIDLEAAHRVRDMVQRSIGESVPVAKVAIPKGLVLGAPIFGSMVTLSDKATISARLIEGIEVEVAAVLKDDLDPMTAERGTPAILEKIDRFVVGIELIGSRFRNRRTAGLFTEFADNLSTAGYVTDPGRTWQPGSDLGGATVTITHNGSTIYEAPAKHVFGSVLAPLTAYAQQPRLSLPLLRGMIITTGTLCGLVPLPGPGRVTAGLGDHTFELEVV